ncbi:hypothetical protein D9619_006215 [Psilocybe cf. subviscida]|uniref:Uncharacterized protein n=1 Tax=Psilocybe cf. subviscida TaxID=2480587 RepID=A0A8H5B3P6_9AGAR|nr:hypothetical protein D9619_006215 [Psilocybe cf. subviscida]
MGLGHDPCGRGQTHNLIAGDNIIVTGGNLTSIQNVYSFSSPDQQVLDILYPRVGPSRIDGRLLHNSNEYEDLRSFCQSFDEFSERICHELADESRSSSILHRESYHLFQRNHSRSIALSVAERLAGQGSLLASIILPSSSRSCTRYIVPTLAYQLAQNIPPSAEHILAAIRHDPCIFERNTATQFKQLIEGPLKMASKEVSFEESFKWPSIIVVDGNAHQFFPDSIPYQVIQLLSTLTANDDLGVNLSLVLTSSITIVDKATRATVTLQQYIVARGNTACYFTWRVHG